MTVVSVTKGADPLVLKMGLSDGSSFFINAFYLPSGFPVPVEGVELDSEGESALSAAAEGYSAERSALRSIAFREQSKSALSAKLRRKDFPDATIKSVLARMEEKGLLDDSRFAVLWLRSRIARKCEGRSRLSAALRSRGVSRDAASVGLDAVLAEGVEAGLIRRMVGGDGNGMPKRTPALLKRLYGAGFSASAIREAFSEPE